MFLASWEVSSVGSAGFLWERVEASRDAEIVRDFAQNVGQHKWT